MRKKWRNGIAKAICSAVLMTFIACDKEDELGNEKQDSFNGTLMAKVENGVSYEAQISKVWALYDAKVNSSGELSGRMLNTGDFTQGGFTIELPDLPASFLMNIQTFFASELNIDAELEYSDPDTRLLDANFFGISSDDKYVDYFVYTNGGTKRTICLFVFAESDATVKGGSVNVRLQRGWNRIYWTQSDKKVSSSAPDGMKWYLNSKIK